MFNSPKNELTPLVLNDQWLEPSRVPSGQTDRFTVTGPQDLEFLNLAIPSVRRSGFNQFFEVNATEPPILKITHDYGKPALLNTDYEPGDPAYSFFHLPSSVRAIYIYNDRSSNHPRDVRNILPHNSSHVSKLAVWSEEFEAELKDWMDQSFPIAEARALGLKNTLLECLGLNNDYSILIDLTDVGDGRGVYGFITRKSNNTTRPYRLFPGEAVIDLGDPIDSPPRERQAVDKFHFSSFNLSIPSIKDRF